MAQNQAPVATLDAVQRIMSKRSKITEDMVGQFVVVTVQGNGNIIMPKNKDGEYIKSAIDDSVLEKRIFNVDSNSGVAMRNDRTKELLRKAYAAERSGDSATAALLYNDYLNKTRISFGVLSSSSLFDKIKSGDQIKAKVAKVTTSNGSLLTLEEISIVAPYVPQKSDVDLKAELGIEEASEPQGSVAFAAAEA